MFKVGDRVDWYPDGFNEPKNERWSGLVVKKVREGTKNLLVYDRSGVEGWLLSTQCKLSEGNAVKTWGEMSPEEKGALLLAHHEDRVIEILRGDKSWSEVKNPNWHTHAIYRVKPEPVVETVELCSEADYFFFAPSNTHKITFNTVDGEPDCSSIKMEKLGNTLASPCNILKEIDEWLSTL